MYADFTDLHAATWDYGTNRAHTPQELWRYSYPLRGDTVPAWAVPLISLFSPVAVILLHAACWRQSSRLEAHSAILAALSCVITTALVTNLIKLGVGRPRPDFVARCWPDGNLRFDAQSGLPACAKGGADPAEGRKSFPSGALVDLFSCALLRNHRSSLHAAARSQRP